MDESPDLEARVAGVGARAEEAVADAKAARHFAAAVDRDLSSSVVVRLDAQRIAINALGVQTAERFDEVNRRLDGMDRRFDAMDRRFDEVNRRLDAHDVGFAQMRAGFDVTAAGMQHLAEMLTVLIDRSDDQGPNG